MELKDLEEAELEQSKKKAGEDEEDDYVPFTDEADACLLGWEGKHVLPKTLACLRVGTCSPRKTLKKKADDLEGAHTPLSARTSTKSSNKQNLMTLWMTTWRGKDGLLGTFEDHLMAASKVVFLQ